MSAAKDGGPAFPVLELNQRSGNVFAQHMGMNLRDWFAGQALSNPALCTGTAPEYELRRWFGERGGITREEIAAAQAGSYADDMIKRRAQP